MFTRRVVFWALALIALIWGVYATQEAFRVAHRRELSRRLTRALDDYEWAPIPRLIHQGADPLTRGSDGLTAMARAASLGDLSTLRIILTRAQTDPLFVSQELPALPNRKVDTTWELADQEESLARLVRQPGSERLVNAWFGLGLVRHRLGRYAEAAHAFREAWRLAPTLARANEAASAAERAAEVSSRVATILPRGTRILASVPLPLGAHDGSWAVVYYQPGDPRKGEAYAWVRVGLYRIRQAGVVPALPAISVSDPRFGDGSSQVGVFCQDLTGDGKPELAVELLTQGASWAPSYLLILSPEPHRWKKLLGLTSSAPLWLEDLNQDGSYEAGNVYEIGDDMSHAEQSRWTDIYALTGDRYQLANRRFPNEFRDWPQALNEVLQAHPEDPGILDYLGRTSEILGRPGVALDYYRRSEAALVPELQQAGYSADVRTELHKRRRELEKRVATLKAAGTSRD